MKSRILLYYSLLLLLSCFAVLSSQYTLAESSDNHNSADEFGKEFTDLKNQGIDTNSVWDLYHLFEKTVQVDTELSLEIAETLFDFYRKKNSVIGVSETYKLLAKLYTLNGNYTKAMQNYELALAEFEKFDQHDYITSIYNDYGFFLGFYLDDFDKAANILNRGIDVIENHRKYKIPRDTNAAIQIYASLGNLYSIQDKYELALNNFLRCVELAEGGSLSFTLGQTYGNIGLNYAYMGMPDSALYYYYLSEYEIHKLFETDLLIPNLNSTLANQYTLVAQLFKDQKQFDSARYNANRAIEYSEKDGNMSKIGNGYKVLGDIYYAENNHKMAESSYLRAIKILEEIDFKDDLRYSYSALAEMYENQGRYKEALEYLKKHRETVFNIFQENMKEEVENVQHQLEIERRENERLQLVNQNELNELKIGQQNSQIIGGSILLVIMLISTSIMISLYRRIKQSNKKLEATIEKLDFANNTKDKLFSIIAHDLKGPLSGFAGIASVLKSNFSKLPSEKVYENIKVLDSSSVKLFGLLENLLMWARAQSGNIKPKFDEYSIKDIVNEAIEEVSTASEAKSIRIITEIPDDILVAVDKDMAKVVIRNVLHNAVKFSFENEEIKIQAQNYIDGKVLLTIADKGVGISSDLQDSIFRIDKKVSTLGTKNEKGTGLGLNICKEFIELNGGEIKFESIEGEGTTFYISFNITGELDKEDEKEHKIHNNR